MLLPPQKVLMPLPSQSFPHPPKGDHCLKFFHHILGLSVLELYKNGIIQYELLCVNLLSFCMFLRFIHVMCIHIYAFLLLRISPLYE